MIPIKELINKIIWDPRENTEDYILYYLDRTDSSLKPIHFDNIKGIDGNFLVLRSGVEIPLHRIKLVKKIKKNKKPPEEGEEWIIVWERKF